MRFAFAGIDFLSDAFDGLVAAGWTPVKLFTRPCENIYHFNDRIVAQATARKIPIQLSRIRAEDLADLGRLGCEALVVAGYPWRVPDWSGHVRYALNFHPSPLPEGRGPYPLYRAILDGRADWGMSAHVLDADFDTGPILARRTFPMSPRESHATLLAKCQMATRAMAQELGLGFERAWAEAAPQEGGTYYRRTNDDDRTLDWRLPVETLMRRVRAFEPIETLARIGASTVYVAAADGWEEAHGHEPGRIVHQQRRTVVVAASDGYVALMRWSPVSLDAARNFGR